MLIFRLSCLLLLFIISLSANNIEKIEYVENIDNIKEINLKNEFFNPKTTAYTISIGTLSSGRYSGIDFFRNYNMENAIAYKFGEKLEKIRVISGVYKTFNDANDAIKKLDSRIQKNNPYAISLKRHQKLFNKYNKSINLSNNPQIKPKKKNFSKKTNSIYTSGTDNSEKLKVELLKEKSQFYAISIATLPSSPEVIKRFFNKHNISDKALAYAYGKNKDNVRVVYGLYKSYSEAKNEIKKLDNVLKSNKPYATKMKNFHSFYLKYNKKDINDNIVELKINEKKNELISDKPKLNNDIKILKKSDDIKRKLLKKEKKKINKTNAKRIIKKIENIPSKSKKVVKKPEKRKENNNKNRFLKHSIVEDIYYIETKGSFNILNEVFLNELSSFYTIDLGELKLSETTIEKFFLNNGMKNEALAYKYGDKKEYARIIYGAYETKKDAIRTASTLDLNVDKKISNIKNHQKLFKMYHENILKKGPSKSVKKIKKETKKIKTKNVLEKVSKDDDIIYLEGNSKNRLKDEFFKSNSPYYTITLITFHKNDLTPKDFMYSSTIRNDILAFSLGSQNDYYRVIYGVFNSNKDASIEIGKLSPDLLKNKPYISKVRTSKDRFESYNNRKVINFEKSAKKININ